MPGEQQRRPGFLLAILLPGKRDRKTSQRPGAPASTPVNPPMFLSYQAFKPVSSGEEPSAGLNWPTTRRQETCQQPQMRMIMLARGNLPITWEAMKTEQAGRAPAGGVVG